MRGFEKISIKQFKRDVVGDYNKIILPVRKTKNSAGYDFHLINDVTLNPGAILKIPLGIKAYMNEDEYLALVIRSSLGFKYNIRLCNQIGVIDSDYYNNSDNEGHIFIAIQNEGSKSVTFKAGDAIIQGIFMKYLIADQDTASNLRTGGIGSTSKGDKE